ncbi:MAG: MFS transporter [Dehalococcoidia bacterium]
MRASHPDRNLRLLFVYWFMRDFQLWIPVWIVFLTLDRGFSLTQVTFAEGLYLVGVLALEVPTGAVADRYGRSASMGLGAVVLGISILIFAFTSSFAILLASFMLWSVASALMSGADMALLFDTLKSAGRDSQYERLAGRGIALSWAGIGTATLFGAPVAALTSTRFTIFVGAATCLVLALVAFAIWEPPHARSDGRQPKYLTTIGSAFAEAWRTVDVRILILLAGSSFAALEAVHYLVQPFLLDRGVEVGVWFSGLQAVMLLTGLGGALLAHRAMARFGVKALVVGPIVGALCYGFLATVPGMAAYAALPVIVAMSSLVEPIATGYINRRIGSEQRATVLSIVSMVRSLVMAFLAPVLGFATDQWGLSEAFAIGGALTLASAIGFGLPLVWRARGAGKPAMTAQEGSIAS